MKHSNKRKIFKAGDWVLYKTTGSNMEGKISVDYQRVQAVLEGPYMGEPCVWIETGFGEKIDALDWGCAQISENAFQDSIAELRPNIYLRRLQSPSDDGIPRAMEVRTFDPKIPLPDFESRRPVIKASRPDTLLTPKGRIPCQYYEMVRTHKNVKSTPEATIERGVESTVKRWLNPDLVPLTGIIREEEHKVYKTHAWPIGKLSSDFPEEINGFDDLKTELIDFGHDAKPMIAHRIRDSRDSRPIEIAP